MDQGYGTDLSLKRKKKPVRSSPERRSYDEESSASTQIRPSSTISAHESKILRKRDKSLATTASRSHSQPRQAEKITGSQAYEMYQVNKRSLSSPRHKDDPNIDNRTTQYYETEVAPSPQLSEDDRLTRLERNLAKFEEERKYFDKEKRKFEKEKREHKLKYRQVVDTEERRKLLESCRNQGHQGSEAEERRRLIQTLRQSYRESAVSARPPKVKKRFVDESSALESSDSELVPRRAPAPPPPIPERKIPSRHSSLSPYRAERMHEETYENVPRKVEPSPARIYDENPVMQEPPIRPISRKSSIPEDYSVEPPVKPVRRSVSRVSDRDTQVVKPLRRRSRASVELEVPLISVPINPVPPMVNEVEPPVQPSRIKSFFGYFFKKKEKIDEINPDTVEDTPKEDNRWFKKYRLVWDDLVQDHQDEYRIMIHLRNRCLSNFVLLVLLCGFGGLMFRYTEGYLENIYKCEVRKVKREFIDVLWSQSHNYREDDWKNNARARLKTFEEELVKYHELNGRSFPGAKAWNFVNSVLFCWTVITTIGYGHIVPQTNLGRSLTIGYAIIGIPIFLILLADFGKVFTRMVKFGWAYVRRLYYHGTCRRVRKHQHMQDVLQGINTMYDVAIRRPSTYFFDVGTTDDDIESANRPNQPATPMSQATHPSQLDTPTTYPETFEVDDEFNLPISLASAILIIYIVVGALVYKMWEDWTYFEAFYFVFISMSTIGFGDLVPQHPIFMMCSIFYLIFGLALTSMFINVVQIKLSDTFKDASAKIGATIGLTMAEEAQSQLDSPKSEGIPSVHSKNKLNDIPESAGTMGAPPVPFRFVEPPPPAEKKKKKTGFFNKK